MGKQTLGSNTDKTSSVFNAKAPSQGSPVQRRRFDQLLGQAGLLFGAELKLQFELISHKAQNFSAPGVVLTAGGKLWCWNSAREPTNIKYAARSCH